MKKRGNIIDSMTRQAVKKIVYQEAYGWPPKCPTFYYHPVRPPKGKQEEPSKNKNTSYTFSA